MFARPWALLLLAATAVAGRVTSPRQTAGRKVFAHYMVGLTDQQSPYQWEQDISQAQSSGIDGFALNIGSADSWNGDQLSHAYQRAKSSGFSLFLSFDMLASSWTTDQVVDLVNQFKGSAAQFKVNGLPFVSTFEGSSWVGNWPLVRNATGGIYLVPDWSRIWSDGGVDLVDGAFNWGAWPEAGQKTMTTGNDEYYKKNLQGKSYMVGVSPYFYTDLPTKYWYSSSDTLWFDRWQQALQVLPDFIEIITWNDFGESSYIIDPIQAQLVSGSEAYVVGFPHSGFRFVLPYFIAAYKAGDANVALPAEGAVAWYRTTPASVCSNGKTVWGQNGNVSAAQGTDDAISVIVLSNSPARITVGIGGSSTIVSASKSVGKAYFYEVPFNSRTGNVTVSLNGKSTTGPSISNSCPGTGHVNFNAVAISL